MSTAVYHLGFHGTGRWITIIVRPLMTHNARTYQISVKSNNPRRSYCNLNKTNLGAIRNLGCDRSGFEGFDRFRVTVHGPTIPPCKLPNFSKIWESAVELLMMKQISQGANLDIACSRNFLDFRNQSASKVSVVENRGQISQFQPCKYARGSN